jgi:hypothetical protein
VGAPGAAQRESSVVANGVHEHRAWVEPDDNADDRKLLDCLVEAATAALEDAWSGGQGLDVVGPLEGRRVGNRTGLGRAGGVVDGCPTG